jgi:protein TonB
LGLNYSRQGGALERRVRHVWSRLGSSLGVVRRIPGVARLGQVIDSLRWPDRWAGWNRGPLSTLAPSERVLALAIAASIILHALLLAIHFQFPDTLRKMNSQTLEVVLVNSKTRQRPVKPDVLAQANLDGGGNTDENRRAKTPLPVLPNEKPGNDLSQAQRRIQELEAQQRQLLTQTQPKAPVVVETPVLSPAPPVPEVKSPLSGADLATRALAIARLEAQVSRSIDEYNKRPRKNFVGARASEYRFAQYVDDWRMKVERIGNINYPDGARGKLYGSLVLEVSIRPNGDIDSVAVMRSSGHQILDRAAERIVRMAAPYAEFPAAVRKDTDILVITRTWHFAPGDKLSAE